MSEEEEGGASLLTWIGLVLISALSFYCQASVTEERFVPALNVIATDFNIPDDVAGATLMAAGASSPELFSSIVALFVTHSALGLGVSGYRGIILPGDVVLNMSFSTHYFSITTKTIVGSEIFNQLVICAGAVFASKSGTLQLDRAIVTREVFFYGLSIGLLLFALHDIEPSDDDQLGEDHIFISFSDACILFGGYILYVLVCAYFATVVRWVTCTKGPELISIGTTTQVSD